VTYWQRASSGYMRNAAFAGTVRNVGSACWPYSERNSGRYIYTCITSDGAMPLNNIIIILYVKCNKNNNKYYNIPAVACAALSIVNQK